MSVKRTAIFLYKSINTLPNDAQFNAIRSQMMWKCREILNITQDNFWCCTACGVAFKKCIPHRKITPTRYDKIRFLKRQLRKEECNRTNYQALYIKKSLKRNYDKQREIIVCQRCKKQYKTLIAKPKLVLKSKRDFKSSETTTVKAAVLKAEQDLINGDTEQEESLNYIRFCGSSKKRMIIIKNIPKYINDRVILLDTPNKKANKSESKVDPKIKNDTKLITPVSKKKKRKSKSKVDSTIENDTILDTSVSNEKARKSKSKVDPTIENDTKLDTSVTNKKARKSKSKVDPTNHSPTIENDTKLDTPVSNKKARKSKRKLDPTNHSPTIENNTKLDTSVSNKKARKSKSKVDPTNLSPTIENDTKLVTPVSKKKAHKSKRKFDPTNHSPKIENYTKLDTPVSNEEARKSKRKLDPTIENDTKLDTPVSNKKARKSKSKFEIENDTNRIKKRKMKHIII